MEELTSFLTTGFYSYVLVFARLVSIFVFVPGFGERFILTQVRVLMAAVLSIMMTPVLAGFLPPIPATLFGLVILILGEVVVGLFLGFVTRLFLYALETAGAIMSQIVGFSNAFITTPTTEQQAAILGGFLSLMGMMLIFTLDLHHYFLMGAIKSYHLFGTGTLLPLSEFSGKYIELVGSTFKVAVLFSAPFLVVGFVFFIGMGLLSRLVTQIQVFFISMPLQLLIGMGVMLMSISSLFLWYKQEIEYILPSLWGY